MAAISSVFTIARVAELLGEDEDLLHEVSLDMEPEDGVLWIYGIHYVQMVWHRVRGVTPFRWHRFPSSLPSGVASFDVVLAFHRLSTCYVTGSHLVSHRDRGTRSCSSP